MKRVMIAGMRSGCGKTTVTCALLKALADRGIDVAAFKCGPDYIDPMFHSRVISVPSRNLDGWFCDINTANYLLQKHSREVSVIEGVMGFYDGAGEGASSYIMALGTGTPAVIVLDCKGMSLSVGAVMKGFLTFREPNSIVGFIFNRLPPGLVSQTRELCRQMGVEYLGRLPYTPDCVIESRHLGLVTADEIAGLKEKIIRLAHLAEEYIDIDKILELAEGAADNAVVPPALPVFYGRPPKIAVARDEAFCFRYEDNMDLLRGYGCELAEFSPLRDKGVPAGSQGLILCGGYPELYAEKLSANSSMRADIRRALMSGMPTIAECGGFMYLHDEMEDGGGRSWPMVGFINGKAYKTPKLRRFGYVTLTAVRDNMLMKSGQSIRAHEFHYWDSTAPGDGMTAEKTNGATYPAAHCGPSLYAGFPHLYFYGRPSVAANFIKKCQVFKYGTC